MAEQAPTHNDGISDFVENTRGVLTATRPDGSTLQMIPAELDQRAGSNAAPRTGYQIIDSRPVQHPAEQDSAPDVEPVLRPVAAAARPLLESGPASSLNAWAGRTGESMTIPGLLPAGVHAELRAATQAPVHSSKG